MEEHLIEIMHTFMELNNGATFREVAKLLPMSPRDVAMYMLSVISIRYTGDDALIVNGSRQYGDTDDYHLTYKLYRQRNAQTVNTRESPITTS